MAVTPAGSRSDWAALARPPRSQQRSPGLPPGLGNRGARRGAGLSQGPAIAGASVPGPARTARARHGACPRHGPNQLASRRRASPRAHLTAPLLLRRSRTNRQKDCARCAPRDPGDAPSVSPAPYTHAPSPPPSDAAARQPRPGPRPTRSPGRQREQATPTSLTREHQVRTHP